MDKHSSGVQSPLFTRRNFHILLSAAVMALFLALVVILPLSILHVKYLRYEDAIASIVSPTPDVV